MKIAPSEVNSFWKPAVSSEIPSDLSVEAYREFCKRKVELSKDQGFTISPDEVHPWLKPHQRDAVVWAVRGGRRALFESFGLGKTVQQLEILRLILKHADMQDLENAKHGILAVPRSHRGLIVAPLGVRQEFKRDAKKLGLEIKFIRSIKEADDTGLYLTNYETVRDGKLDPNQFLVTSLDEADCLRAFGGSRTYREFLVRFADVPYRFVATATPDPNEYIELLAYAAYLGIMDVSQAKTRWFKRDSTKADKLTIHPHKETEFWGVWVPSWALFLQRPSDLGHDDAGYALPDFEVIYHEVSVDHTKAESFERNGQQRMFREALHGVVDAAREKRDTLPERIECMKEILAAEPDEHFLIWHDLEAEREAIEDYFAENLTLANGKAKRLYASCYGSQDIDERERNMIDFAEGRLQNLGGKPVQIGSGGNYQRHCARAIFLGIGFKFKDFIQSLHRIVRYLQPRPVKIHIIYAGSERRVLENLLEKWSRYKERAAKMSEIIKEHGLSQQAMMNVLHRSLGVERVEVKGENHTLINNDSVEELGRGKVADESVDLILTSIPFGTQYEYSCYDEHTEVLTRRGWKSFGELDIDEQLGTVNPETLKFEWQTPSRIVWEPYCGDMVHFYSRNSFDMLVTPNHRMFVDARVSQSTGRKPGERIFTFLTADLVEESFVPRKWAMVAAASPGDGVRLKHIFYPRTRHRTMPNTRKELNIGALDFMELAGWYLSEGSCRRGEISISQSRKVNAENFRQISDLWKRIGLPIREWDSGIVANNADLANFLVAQFGHGSYLKRIPRWIKDLHPDLLRAMRDTMMKGDGSDDGFAYKSVSKSLRDDFQEICFLTGWRTSIAKDVVQIGQKDIFPQIRNKPEICQYTGMVGCASVPNRTLVVRRGGAVIVSGNSAYEDFGHSESNSAFFRQMDFLTPHLLRVLKPGRFACIHVKDRIVPGGVSGTGVGTVYPFHMDTTYHFLKHGFLYMGMKTIVTDVVRENNQTYRLGWTEQCKDGTKMGVGMPEYLLIFRKPQTDTTKSYADTPVVKLKRKYSRSRWQIDAHGFTRSSGDRLLTPAELENLPHHTIFKLFREFSLANVYDFEHHVKLGEALEEKGILPVTFMLLQPQSWHPDVWTDITRMRTLNGAQSAKGREMHLCPMQFDLADRAIEQHSQEGELVFDPFGGLMSVPYRAILKGRKALGIELNARYFLDGCSYVEAAAREQKMPGLFDTLEAEGDQLTEDLWNAEHGEKVRTALAKEELAERTETV